MDYTFATSSYTVTVGQGGSSPNINGGDSIIAGMIAKGGGGGTNYQGPAGKVGGSGGGAEGTETNPAGATSQPSQNTSFTADPNFNQYGNPGGTILGLPAGGGSLASFSGPGPGFGGKGGDGPIPGFEYLSLD